MIVFDAGAKGVDQPSAEPASQGKEQGAGQADGYARRAERGWAGQAVAAQVERGAIADPGQTNCRDMPQRVGHEGFVPFFESFAGALADDIAAALREAGLDDHARAVTSAMALFGATYPIDRNERLRRIGGADGLAARLAVLGAPLEEIPARRAADAAVLDLVKRAGMLPE